MRRAPTLIGSGSAMARAAADLKQIQEIEPLLARRSETAASIAAAIEIVAVALTARPSRGRRAGSMTLRQRRTRSGSDAHVLRLGGFIAQETGESEERAPGEAQSGRGFDFAFIYARLMTACGFTPAEIDEMTLFDVMALFEYWRDFPPSHEILKLAYRVERKPALPKTGNTTLAASAR